MEFKITIDQFEGPLDLMTHLIKENKLDLFDLDMLTLANQYIAYIHQMQDMHLEVASEYLEELAGLIEYKSRMLLPRQELELDDNYEETERDKLVSRLLEYQRYKEVTELLKTEYELRKRHFTRAQSPLVDEWSTPQESLDLPLQSPYELMKAMKNIMARTAILNPYSTQVTIKEVSVEDRIEVIKSRLEYRYDTISFEELCSDCFNVRLVVVTFLAILDLIHTRWLDFSVDENHIWVRRVRNDESN